MFKQSTGLENYNKTVNFVSSSTEDIIQAIKGGEEEKQKYIESVNQCIEQELQVQKRVHPGIYFTPNLALTYEGNNSAKKCDVPDQWKALDYEDNQNVSLHQRLAMTEALVVSKTDDLSQLRDITYISASDRNYVTANIGFVVSNKEHKFHKDQGYKRIFITVPVDDATYAIYKGASSPVGEPICDQYGNKHYEQWDNPHSERTFYNYLKDINTAQRIALALTDKLRFLRDSFIGYKVYAIIVDIHTSRDMCNRCEESTYALQQGRVPLTFLGNMEYILEKQFGYVLPKEKNYNANILQPNNKRLDCVTRVSSYLSNGQSSDRPKQQINDLVAYPYRRINGSIYEEDIEAEIDQEGNRNIKRFFNSVILHTNFNSWEKYKFYNKGAYLAVANTGQTFFSLPKQTVFANTNSQTDSVPKKAPIIRLT